MDPRRVEHLLREYAGLRPRERLLSDDRAVQLRSRLAPGEAERELELERDASIAESGPPLAAHARSSRRRWLLCLGGTAAAAAVFLVMILSTPESDTALPVLVVDGAYDQSSLFRTARGETAQGETIGGLFHIGVRPDRAAYVRLIAIGDSGRLEPLPLDRSGALELRVPGGGATVFGGYEVVAGDGAESPSTLQAVMVIASCAPLPDADVSSWISSRSGTISGADESDWATTLADIQERLQCVAELVRR